MQVTGIYIPQDFSLPIHVTCSDHIYTVTELICHNLSFSSKEVVIQNNTPDLIFFLQLVVSFIRS